MEWNLSLFGFAGAALALIFAYVQSRKVFGYSEGTERMQKLAAAIRKGANAYLKQQYATVFKVFLAVFVILLILAATGNLNWFTPFAFCTGENLTADFKKDSFIFTCHKFDLRNL